MRRLFVRWLTHRSRIPPALRASAAWFWRTIALVGLAAAVTGPAGTAPGSAAAASCRRALCDGRRPSARVRLSDQVPRATGSGQPDQEFPRLPGAPGRGIHALPAELLVLSRDRPGGDAGHGAVAARRRAGAGRLLPLHRTDAARQPRARSRYATPRRSTAPEIDALIAYISSFGGPAAPTANPADGNLALGFQQFTLNCAGCHQIVARGGITVNAQIPDLQDATPQELAEAVRMGPYLMPHFDSNQIDQHQLDSIARYLVWTRHPDNAGGWGIYNIGPDPRGDRGLVHRPGRAGDRGPADRRADGRARMNRTTHHPPEAMQ